MRPIDDRVGQWRPAKRICMEHMSRLVHRTSVRTSNLIHGKGKAKPLYRILGLSQAYGNMAQTEAEAVQMEDTLRWWMCSAKPMSSEEEPIWLGLEWMNFR